MIIQKPDFPIGDHAWYVVETQQFGGDKITAVFADYDQALKQLDLAMGVIEKRLSTTGKRLDYVTGEMPEAERYDGSVMASSIIRSVDIVEAEAEREDAPQRSQSFLAEGTIRVKYILSRRQLNDVVTRSRQQLLEVVQVRRQDMSFLVLQDMPNETTFINQDRWEHFVGELITKGVRRSIKGLPNDRLDLIITRDCIRKYFPELIDKVIDDNDLTGMRHRPQRYFGSRTGSTKVIEVASEHLGQVITELERMGINYQLRDQL